MYIIITKDNTISKRKEIAMEKTKNKKNNNNKQEVSQNSYRNSVQDSSANNNGIFVKPNSGERRDGPGGN